MSGVAIIARKSSPKEAAVSVARQVKTGRAWAALHHPELEVEVFADEGVSGVDMTRDGWARFTTAVRTGRIAVVWAYEQSRLTRAGTATWDDVCVMLHKAGIAELHTARQGVISVIEGNRLQGRILAVVDQEERERARLRVIDAMDDLAREGRPAGGRPFGYRYVVDATGRKALEIDEVEAAVIREIAQRILDGQTLRRIALDLQDRGVASARGGRWQIQNVRSVVLKPSVAGLRVHRGEIIGPAAWPPVLERDVWERIRAVFADTTTVLCSDGTTRRVPRSHRTGRRYLLTGGVARCGKCGTKMIGQVRANRGRNDRQPIYTCHTTCGPDACCHISIIAEPLEASVSEAVRERLRSPKLAARLNRRDNRAISGAMANIETLENRQRFLARRLGAGDLTMGEWDEARSEIQGRLLQARAELARHVDVDLVDDPAALAERWDDLELSKRRQLVAMLIDAVVISPASKGTERVEVRWRA